ncbi:MAG: 2-oxo acid dehydrogenase subunit E2 [Thermoplasmatales archaeon]|nr:2-oxo acid dehydrogenase subunit E2 [Thermoplasmatales archaeon]
MNNAGNYQTKPFSKYRKNIQLIAGEGWRKHSLHFLIEANVTKSLEIIKNYKKEGKDVSFTGWIIKCLSQAIVEHKELNSYRQGRNKIVIFDDVDVAIPVEKKINDDYIPMAYIIRRANEKSIWDITEEIRNAQKRGGKEQVLMKLSFVEKFVLKSPYFIKKFILFLLRKRGIIKKKHMGTVGVTSVGMFGNFSGWIIPLGGTTSILLVVNGISKKPVVRNDKIETAEILHLTLTFDHDLADGGKISRFISRFVELVENGFSLS